MTFSIVARDPRTGAFGVATATGGPCVGALVPYVAAGAGAIATQGDTNPFYGVDGLKLLADGQLASAVVQSLTGGDDEPDIRQCLVIGASGQPAAWTGDATLPASGHLTGDDYAIGGNMLGTTRVIEAMETSFTANANMPLAEALLAALLAGERAGGDMRGIRSAALRTCTDQAYPDIDIRVDFDGSPLERLAELLQLCRTGTYAEFMANRPRR